MSKNEQASIVTHSYPPEKPGTGKTIIIFHGWGSSVKNYKEFAKSLSSRGFGVIVPELTFHDSRNKLENHFSREITQEYFWQTIFSTIDEADCLFKEMGIPKKDIILLGVSMGGFIANGIYADSQEFAGLININGSGSYLMSEKIFRENDDRPALSIEETQKFTSYDPMHKNKEGSPVLLMHGERDVVVSIKGQEDYYAYLSEGSSGKDIKFLKYADVNHAFSEEMIGDLVRWLEGNFGIAHGK